MLILKWKDRGERNEKKCIFGGDYRSDNNIDYSNVTNITQEGMLVPEFARAKGDLPYIGQAASMGAVLLSAGTKGMRYSLPSSRIMIHQPSGGAMGQATEIEISYKEIQRLKDILNGILAKNTGKKISEIEKYTDRDHFMSADEAKKFGLIDKVI